MPLGVTARSFGSRNSREVTRPRIACATGPNTAISAVVRFSAIVLVPAASLSAVACASMRAIRSVTSSARKLSKSAKWRCRTPLAKPASVVTARLVSALGPSRSRTRSAASNSCSRAFWIVTPVGTRHILPEWADAH